MPNTTPTRNLAFDLVRVTEAAALAAGRMMGRGDKNGADKAAVDAMRVMLNSISMRGTIIIGEGEKDEAPMLYNGEKLAPAKGRKSISRLIPLKARARWLTVYGIPSPPWRWLRVEPCSTQGLLCT